MFKESEQRLLEVGNASRTRMLWKEFEVEEITKNWKVKTTGNKNNAVSVP